MERKARRFLEFDTFRVDVEGRTLLCEGSPVAITPKVFDLLLLLLENNGHTLQKDELMDKVWADTFVYEGNLNRHISMLRKVLSDDVHGPRFIKTVPKRGYRFDGEVREVIQEEESLLVEKRTNYRLAIKESVATEGTGRSKIVWLVPAILAAGILVFLFGFAPQRSFFGDAVDTATARDAKAYELYLAGRQLWQTRKVEDLHNATRKLELAVNEAPDFALAHAALADAYAFDYVNWRKAEYHANEAIRLDASLGEPFATIGFVRTFWEWKPVEAEEFFKKALLLRPNYATAHQWFALNLAIRSRGGLAVAEMRTAAELDPSSGAIQADLCQVLYFDRKYDLAAAQCTATLARDPTHNSANQYLFDVYLESQRFDEAVGQFTAMIESGLIHPMTTREVESLRQAYETSGIRSFYEMQLGMLEKHRRGSYQAARFHARLGNRAETYRWLRRAAEERDFDLVFIAADPALALIERDPEFKDLVFEVLGLRV